MDVYVKMSFKEIFLQLEFYHDSLWFYADTGKMKLTDCDYWQKGRICSKGGKPLACQFGHPDEWLLTPLWYKPDTGLIIDEPDEDSRITDRFLREVNFLMTYKVHPYIDVNGQYIRPDAS
ncbi:hypothetical protein ACP3TG_29060 [Phytobacter diazotrophicus]